ncbi:lipocalin family protein [Brevundimonas sp.]|uniref:lipocalin family protein n=1 Tax=Brevundimonas sp. TaxID=1871086 RepID=UPI001A1C5AF1|nr:lipocalin family protein [Brevundimonas sp.]MBJ7484770.1 lipocalin family protein [Brevundimonas sp.]
MRKLHSIAVALALLAGSAGAALAQAPEPRATINVDRFMGRWYEIARTPNDHQRDCWAASQVWSRRNATSFAISQTCHRGSRTGRATTVNTNARVLDTATNAKWEASFFGGLIRQRYWVIDIAPDYSWMIATTADGQFPALLSRSPTMSAAQKTELIARMGRLGLPTRQLISR